MAHLLAVDKPKLRAYPIATNESDPTMRLIDFPGEARPALAAPSRFASETAQKPPEKGHAVGGEPVLDSTSPRKNDDRFLLDL